ncbi:MAG: hypothetical protein M1823_003400 [Watsoniomyces obsoletus]|nr:MAG: hypothetical protein M1823_003400 [Watsoniomyces obsoletus]
MGSTTQPTMAESIDAILTSRPPATDHTTYLTILEEHLRPELLPTLQEVLQDHDLTENIGWDLVGLLVPLLPESKACLWEVARWGNPREVILKVLESLREIEFEDEDDDDENEGLNVSGISEEEISNDKPTSEETKTNVDDDDEKKVTPAVSRAVLQFKALLPVLGILHSRIKTQSASRFVSSTLQAVLACYAEAAPFLPWRLLDEITQSIIQLVQTLSGKKRPPLPPRQQTNDVSAESDVAGDADVETKDEDEVDSAANPSSGEDQAIQERLLQSFVTHLLEEYLVSTPRDDEIPGLAWAARFQEKAHPDRIIPVRPSVNELFADRAQLQSRERTVEGLVTLARELKLENAALMPSITEDPESLIQNDDDHPSAASDIPLSRPGCLFILVSTIASHYLSQSSDPYPTSTFAISPHHNRVVQVFLGANGDNNSMGVNIGRQPGAIVDAIITLGLWAYEDGRLGSLGQTEVDEFNIYLQKLSLLSIRHPSSSIRAHSHILSSAILHAHPIEKTRHAIIIDILKRSHDGNMKALAVEWFKDELLSANRPSSEKTPFKTATTSTIFTDPKTLRTLAPLIFTDLRNVVHLMNISQERRQQEQAETTRNDGEVEEYRQEILQVNLETYLPFYMASLNLLFLLLNAKDLKEGLNVLGLFLDRKGEEEAEKEKENDDGYDILSRFLIPLHQAIGHHRRLTLQHRIMSEMVLKNSEKGVEDDATGTAAHNDNGDLKGDESYQLKMARLGMDISGEDLSNVYLLEIALERVGEGLKREGLKSYE